MNEVFSFSRFRRLFVKHTMEHYRTYLMSIAVLAGVFILGGAFVFYMIPEPPDPGFQTAVFVILLILSGTLFTSTVFSDYGEKTKAIPALTLPATALEKFLVGWLYSFPIFIAVYVGIFYLALYGLSSGRHWDANQHFFVMNLRQNGQLLVFVVFAFLHGLSLFGAVYFRKLQFIKSGFAFFVSFGVVIVVNSLFLKVITGLSTIKLAIPFGFLDFDFNDRSYSITAEDTDLATKIMIVLALLTVLLWTAAYFRLKEKQV
ncbi:MAG TPA: hypothetical protein VMH27_22525 [Puia sp.]|nr:hypothetical protein [Puia sp.]